jgi:hypothetical protein
MCYAFVPHGQQQAALRTHWCVLAGQALCVTMEMDISRVNSIITLR